MTMPGTVIGAAVTGLFSSGALITGALWWFERRDKGRVAREGERVDALAKQRELDETWFREAQSAYNRLDAECARCNKQLEILASRFYRLIGALDELCDNSENGVVKAHDLRGAVRIARQEPSS